MSGSCYSTNLQFSCIVEHSVLCNHSVGAQGFSVHLVGVISRVGTFAGAGAGVQVGAEAGAGTGTGTLPEAGEGTLTGTGAVTRAGARARLCGKEGRKDDVCSHCEARLKRTLNVRSRL